MISVPAEILMRPGPLTEMKQNNIKNHPRAGYKQIKETGLPYPIPEIILQHHERMDGSGYPLGLKNSEKLLEARILAVTDTVEAAASTRPYRPVPDTANALREIKSEQGILTIPR